VILLDTHAALWFAMDNGLLGKRSQRTIDRALEDDQLAVSVISFWEITLLIAKRRVRSIDSAAETRDFILRAGIGELPLTGEIAILAGELNSLHGDAATAIRHDATLVTADEKQLRWRHSLRRRNAEL
jgi:PIN domain nuclease of toxin-antitoxin system